MKLFNGILLVFLMALFLSAAVTPSELKEPKATQHKAMHLIVMENDDQTARCTAYAISAHVLLTAQHCDLKDGVLTVDKEKQEREIVEKVYDNMDHMLLVVPSENFTALVDYNPDTYVPPAQGERIYYWGNPAQLRDQYREGYMTGKDDSVGEDDDRVNASGEYFVFSATGGPGDSGASVFGCNGRIVTVVTYGIDGGQLMGGYPLKFTSGQVKQAKNVK